MAQDVKQWEDALEPVLGSVNILFYANGSDLDSYEGAKFQTLYEAGFRYFCALDSSVTSWVQIADTYVRQARRTINGTRITQEPIWWRICLTPPKSSPRTVRSKYSGKPPRALPGRFFACRVLSKPVGYGKFASKA